MTLARKVAVNTANLTVGRLALAGSGLIGTAATTRYLGLDAFGSLTLALLLVSLVATIGDAGVYQVVAREIARRPQDEDKLLRNTLGVGIAAALVTTGLALAVSTLAYGGADDELVRQGVAIIGIQLLFTGFGGTAYAYLTAQQRLTPLAYAAVASSFGFLIVLGLAIGLDWGFAGVAAAYGTGGLLSGLPALWLWRDRGLRVAADLRMWRQILVWAAPQGLIVVLGVVYFRLDMFLLSFLSGDGDDEVALYGLAYKVVEVLMFVPGYFVATLFPEFARAERGSEKLAGMAQAGFTLLQLMALVTVIVFAGFASETVRVVGGPGFGDAGVVLALLSCGLVFLYVNTLFFQALIAMGEQRRLVWLVLAVLGLNVALNFALIPPLGAVGAAIAVVASEVLSVAIGAWLFRVATGSAPRPFRVPQTLAATAAGVAGVVAAKAAGALLDAPAIAVLGVGAPLALGLFAATLIALRSVPGELVDLTAALRQRLAVR